MRGIPFARFLSDDGTTSGTKNANGDYSSVAAEWIFDHAEVADVHRLIVTIEDTAGFQAEEYGNLAAALTNGIEIEIRDDNDTVLVDLTDSIPIKTNADWGSHCYDVDLKTWGAGDEVLLVRWTFANFGRPLGLDANQKLVVKLNDNFTGLVGHYFVVQGVFHGP